MRKDVCKLQDCVNSATKGFNRYFTGSKTEGLYLPGSDVDFMRDIDKTYVIQVIEQGKTVPQSRGKHLFEMVTDNVQPAFAMLRIITPDVSARIIFDSLQVVDDSHFLSSYLIVHDHFSRCKHKNVKIQGPSLEHKESLGDTDTDYVFCIHCDFWPNVPYEWVHRTRLHNWPDVDVINKIVDFGFHFVPVGYPLSPMSMMEWRISFSIAERLLVWSFNHTQIQMYAILKVILKEFIKIKCTTVK